MIVFKTFLKILNKCKAPIIMYTMFLVFFSAFNMSANETVATFEASKPDVAIVNEDVDEGITASLVDYMSENSIIKEYEVEDERLDALFYRDVNYIIYIPDGYRDDFLAGKNPKIEVKSTGDYQASLAEMMLERYVRVANTYRELVEEEKEIVKATEKTLSSNVSVRVTSKLDSTGLEKASRYYNFMNYCLLAGAIFIICLVLSIFRSEGIAKRTIVSSMNYKSFNRKLLWCNALFSLGLWSVYVLISLILVGDVMFSMHGLFLIINSFIFSFCALTIAFLLGTIVRNKEAINGIVNVIALGSSFLCGAFVPMEWLPDTVLNIAHILPSYWFIKTNEMIKTIEVFDWVAIKPLLLNMGVLVGFAVGFVIVTNILSKKKQKIG